MIYFVRSGLSSDIKIGFTDRDVQERVSELALPNPVILLTLVGDRKTEADLHRRFASSRIGREWFRESPELLSFIKSHRGKTAGVAELWERGNQLYDEVVNLEW